MVMDGHIRSLIGSLNQCNTLIWRLTCFKRFKSSFLTTRRRLTDLIWNFDEPGRDYLGDVLEHFAERYPTQPVKDTTRQKITLEWPNMNKTFSLSFTPSLQLSAKSSVFSGFFNRILESWRINSEQIPIARLNPVKFSYFWFWARKWLISQTFSLM